LCSTTKITKKKKKRKKKYRRKAASGPGSEEKKIKEWMGETKHSVQAGGKQTKRMAEGGVITSKT